MPQNEPIQRHADIYGESFATGYPSLVMAVVYRRLPLDGLGVVRTNYKPNCHMNERSVYYLLFTILLHTAQRAMAAAMSPVKSANFIFVVKNLYGEESTYFQIYFRRNL